MVGGASSDTGSSFLVNGHIFFIFFSPWEGSYTQLYMNGGEVNWKGEKEDEKGQVFIMYKLDFDVPLNQR